MKKCGLLISVFLMILSFLLSGSPVIAAEKTGFIDMREIMMKSDAGKKASDDFKKLYEKDRDKIQAREAELKKLKDELEKQKTILTESAMKEKEAAYQKKFRDYQLVVKDSNEELQARDQEFSKKMIPEILKVVNAIGERGKYALIIDVSTIPIAYYAKEKDLSKQVIEELNKTYKPSK
jgi:outer membrane protein